MKIYSIFVLISFALSHVCLSQNQPSNGLKDSKPAYIALKNATIYISPDKVLKNGTIIIKDNKIVKYGTIVSIPKEAVEIDCTGKTILPAFIEVNAEIGLPKVENKSTSRSPQLESQRDGAGYWNEAIHPEVDAYTLYKANATSNKTLQEMGFGYALTHQKDGIARGTGAFVSLGNETSPFLKTTSPVSYYSLKKGVSRQTYPSSQMGCIALLRQAFYDAAWYEKNNEQRNTALEAINLQKKETMLFETSDKWEILRAYKIAEEFGIQFSYLGSGNEYEIASTLRNMNSHIIIPINFPEAYDVKNPYVSRQIPLSELKHWELAPMNPSILAQNKVQFSITSNGMKSAKDFWTNLRRAIQLGLTEEHALQALTTEPAKLIRCSDQAGSLEEGRYASFSIFSDNPFQKEAKLLESWVMGTQFVHETTNEEDIAGKYNLLINDRKFKFELTGSEKKYKGKLTYRTLKNEIYVDTTAELSVELTNNDITLQFNLEDSAWTGSVTLQGKTNAKLGVFEGDGLLPTGKWTKWSAIKQEKAKSSASNEKPIVADTVKHIWFPNMAFGYDSIPKMENIVIKNATLWTNEKDGIVQNGDIVIQNGKILHVGFGNYKTPQGAHIIDAKGKHVTAGIIDEHSHIAISRGVNEGGQAISSEVRIGDVINPNDINIYRQLSGGVTMSQLLHGSANPIGGQSAIIKLKWGSNPEEMLLKDQPQFIKFALGENVKQSNWGDYNTIRFPQTRMGVEQLYYDGFLRAKDYAKKRTSKSVPVDLELEALAEILDGKRHITCHSYVQSEINMLMHVADSLGFKVNTFTHILEGYKVADKMKAHGAGGSTFSDWWAYKYEVNDAIPYNAAMMHNQGVVVAINSDDAEMGRRLNQEAAKGVKYGGMSEEDAWKMVTLNPAKLLHVDDRVGSLKVGKDADIVIWSDNPLSVNAVVEQTIVDGAVVFDRDVDGILQERNNAERARIISKMLEANGSGSVKPFIKKKKGHYHCNTMGEEMSTEENHH